MQPPAHAVRRDVLDGHAGMSRGSADISSAERSHTRSATVGMSTFAPGGKGADSTAG
jgi:hypothetical protein